MKFEKFLRSVARRSARNAEGLRIAYRPSRYETGVLVEDAQDAVTLLDEGSVTTQKPGRVATLVSGLRDRTIIIGEGEVWFE